MMTTMDSVMTAGRHIHQYAGHVISIEKVEKKGKIKKR
jgi:hypothetical protein